MTLIAMVTMTISAQAMSYEQAREQALFLTDKMAYELNLTEDQYEAAYEVNLDYLLGVETQEDLYGEYWTRRNLDLSYILLDWQYSTFCAAAYFYRPLYWSAGCWHFGIYARYPHRNYFYFGRPHFWYTYRGAHAWHRVGGHGWYHGRTFGQPHRIANNHRGFGMRNGFDRGDFRRHSNGADRGRMAPNSRGRIAPNHDRTSPRDRGNIGNDRGNRRENVGGDRSENVRRNSDNSARGNRDGAYNRQSSTRETVGHSRSESGSSSSTSPSFNRSRSSSSGSSFNHSRSSSSGSSFNRSSSSSFGGSSRGGSSFNGGSRGGSSSFGGGSHGGHGGGRR